MTQPALIKGEYLVSFASRSRYKEEHDPEREEPKRIAVSSRGDEHTKKFGVKMVWGRPEKSVACEIFSARYQ